MVWHRSMKRQIEGFQGVGEGISQVPNLMPSGKNITFQTVGVLRIFTQIKEFKGVGEGMLQVPNLIPSGKNITFQKRVMRIYLFI